MNVSDIKRGKWLHRAQQTSVEDFFEKRATNRLRKTVAGNWDVLYEDFHFVYFGRPALRLFSSELKIDVLYKVDKEQLQIKLPYYQFIDGISLSRKIMGYIRERMPDRNDNGSYPTLSFLVRLQGEVIRAEVQRTTSDGIMTYYLLLNRDSLELVLFQDGID